MTHIPKSISGSAQPPVATSDFVTAMSQHAASVAIITTADGELRYGLTATAMSSVSAMPPRLLVCVNKSGATHEKIVSLGIFAVNVLSEGQEKVAKAFSGMLGKDFHRFSVGDWTVLATGSPILQNTSSSFDCKLVQTIDQSTHSIFIGEVLATTAKPGHDALLYANRRFRHLRKSIGSPREDIEYL